MSGTNVLHVTGGLVYGGVERFLETLVAHRGADPDTRHDIAVCGGGVLTKRLRKLGGGVHDLGRIRRRYPWTVWQGRRRLEQLLRAARIDVVVMHSGWPLGLLGGASVVRGRPVVLWQHGGANPEHWVERLASRRSVDLVIGNSDWTLGTLDGLRPGVPRCKLRYPVASSGDHARASVPSDAGRRELRNTIGTPDEAVVIVTACRMEAWKGHALLLRGLAAMRAKRPWACWIAGGAQRPAERAYVDGIERSIAELGLEDRVTLLGQRDDVPALLTAADVYCQPNSGPEPFGIAFVEALAAGRPVVTTALGGPLEIVDDATGTLVPPDDEVALAAALDRAVDDDAWRRTRGAAGPRRAQSLCDPVSRVRDLGETLRTLAEMRCSEREVSA